MRIEKIVSGQEISITVSNHAFNRFIERYNILNPDNKVNHIEAIKLFVEAFKRSKKIKRLSKTKRIRNGKYQKPQEYFLDGNFNFIVAEKTLVTVELNGDAKYLN